MAAVDTASNSRAPMDVLSNGRTGIRVDDLKRIDINHLSKSELMALSLSSSSAFDLRRTEDVVSPQVDRSVFNESAGGRRQTYSHLHHRSHSRLPGLHPSFKAQRQSYALSDPVNHSVVHYLKHFINGVDNPPPPPPPPPPQQEEIKGMDISHMKLGIQENYGVQRGMIGKRKNLSETRIFENGALVEMQRVNDQGETVDLAELEKNGEELFAEELKRRTIGLETEEAVLGFLRDLDGQWCSRRKKRKYVNANVFCYALPIGWKVLLGLRRRDSRVSVYCRRYISPAGRQFMSCIEAGAYLKSYFGSVGADQRKDEKEEQNTNPASTTDENVQCKAAVDGSLSNSRVDDRLNGIDDLPEVQVKDVFECFKCRLTFDDKNVYLQHVLLSHQKIGKRHKFGRPIGEGVIIKDGKFECQFCHKVFDEKRSYSGHVGIHVRNSGKNSGEFTNTVSASKSVEPLLPEAATSIKMDALVEVAQSSISETSVVEPTETAVADPSPLIECLGSSAAHAENAEKVDTYSVEELHEDVVNSNIAMIEDLNQCTTVMTESNDMVKNDFEWNVNVEMDASCINDSEHTREIEKYGAIDLDIGFESLKPSDGNMDDKQALTECSPVPLVQSFQFFPPFSSSDTAGNEFSVADQKLDSVTGFEELRFDDIEPYIPSLAGGSINLTDNSAMELGFSASVGFGSEAVILSSMNRNQLTVCVWCRSEFRLEGIESETPTDSIGYMCPTCKAKISGHFGGSLSMDLHDF